MIVDLIHILFIYLYVHIAHQHFHSYYYWIHSCVQANSLVSWSLIHYIPHHPEEIEVHYYQTDLIEILLQRLIVLHSLKTKSTFLSLLLRMYLLLNVQVVYTQQLSLFIPEIITHSPPLFVSTDLHSSLSIMATSSKSNITIFTNCIYIIANV